MHSTIYEFSEQPISESRRATIDSLPEWFFQTVADYYESSPNPLFGAALWRPLYKGRRSAAVRLRLQGSVFPKVLSLFYGGSEGFGKDVL